MELTPHQRACRAAALTLYESRPFFRTPRPPKPGEYAVIACEFHEHALANLFKVPKQLQWKYRAAIAAVADWLAGLEENWDRLVEDEDHCWSRVAQGTMARLNM